MILFHRLTINFKVGHSANEGTIAFHFRVIMSSKTILCNSFLKGSWGKEDPKMENMGNSFPFPPGQHFDLMILVDHNAFKVGMILITYLTTYFKFIEKYYTSFILLDSDFHLRIVERPFPVYSYNAKLFMFKPWRLKGFFQF